MGRFEELPVADQTFQFERNDREDALMLASGLAWAVGKLEGMGQEAGYAGQMLDWWRHPRIWVQSGEASDAGG